MIKYYIDESNNSIYYKNTDDPLDYLIRILCKEEPAWHRVPNVVIINNSDGRNYLKSITSESYRVLKEIKESDIHKMLMMESLKS